MGLRRPEGQCSQTSLDTGGAATAEKTLLGDPPPVPSYFNVGLGIRPHAALHPSVRCWAGPSVRPPRGGDWMWVVFPPGVLARCVYWHLRFLLNNSAAHPTPGPPNHVASGSPVTSPSPEPQPLSGEGPPVCTAPHLLVGVFHKTQVTPQGCGGGKLAEGAQVPGEVGAARGGARRAADPGHPGEAGESGAHRPRVQEMGAEPALPSLAPPVSLC